MDESLSGVDCRTFALLTPRKTGKLEMVNIPVRAGFLDRVSEGRLH